MSGGNGKRAAAQVASLAPQARTATANGASCDMAGFRSALVVVDVGTITDGAHTPKLQESDDNSTWSDVAAGDLEGTFANLATATNQIVGYKGRKRFIRAVMTVAGAATGGVYGVVLVRVQAMQA
jgi:hypothetical protein